MGPIAESGDPASGTATQVEPACGDDLPIPGVVVVILPVLDQSPAAAACASDCGASNVACVVFASCTSQTPCTEMS
jgi:hypothetical protein